ncbi:MAG: DUF5050 domain-containing protein [Alistipes sp.]|nr:DUF5050 domain-containing protein [Alistipes sp.]
MRRQFGVVLTAATLSVLICSCGKDTQQAGVTAADKTDAALQTESTSSLQTETSGMEELSGMIDISGTSVGGEAQNVPNSNAKYGNTAGNLINSGIVCEGGGRIYYYNKSDDKKLYVMNKDGSGKEALGDIRGAIELNFFGDYIYYQAGGIFRASVKSGEVETLVGDTCRNVVVTENTIFYLKADGDSTKVHRMDLDGSGGTVLSDDIAGGLNVGRDKIYYINGSDSGRIYSMNFDGSDNGVFLDDKNVQELLVEAGMVYFVSGGGHIYRTDESGGEAQQVGEDECSNININNGRLFYYNVTDNALCCAGLDGSDEMVLYSGELNAVNVISDWVYFFNTDDYQYYRISKDGNNIEVVE